MMEEQGSPEIEGYITITEAARRLGIASTVVYKYIDEKRLNILRIAKFTLISEESVRNFGPKSATGRPRTKPALWREAPAEAPFFITVMRATIRKGQQETFMGRLRAIRQQREHLFPGTVARYISEIDAEPGSIEIQLVWKQNEMPDEAEYEKQMQAFRETFAGVLDWDKAQSSTKTVLLHT
jgi:excisionase family DNA binding protein